MKHTSVILAAAVGLFAAGCSDPSESVPKAEVSTDDSSSSAGDLLNAAADAVTGTIYTIDTAATKVEFTGSKVTGSHDGGFENVTGALVVNDGKVASTGNTIVIDMTSTWSDSDRLTGHLKSPDFFGVEEHPTATFVTTAVEDAKITGDLTLHGVTKSISFPAEIAVSDDAVSVKAEFSINRFDFGIKYAGKADDLIREGVVIRLDVKAAPKA